MKKSYSKKCERCDGTGRVFSYKGKPLYCSVEKGHSLRNHYNMSEEALLKFKGEPLAQLQVMFALKLPENWGALICPECKGREKWSYTIEQLPHKSPVESPEVEAIPSE